MMAKPKPMLFICILCFLWLSGAWIINACGDVVPVGGTYSGEITLNAESLGTFSITLNVPQGTVGMMLQPGTDNERLASLIIADYPEKWQVSISSNTGGYMAEYDTTNGNNKYVDNGNKLGNPLIIKALDKEIDLSKGGILSYIDVKTNPEDNGNLVIPITFIQRVVYTDLVLPKGHVYNIVVTFSGSEVI